MAERQVILGLGQYVTLTNTALPDPEYLHVVCVTPFDIHINTSGILVTFDEQKPTAELSLWGGSVKVEMTFNGNAVDTSLRFLGYHFTIKIPDELTGTVTASRVFGP